MLDKLQNLDDKYEELGRMLADPEVLANPEELRKTAKAILRMWSWPGANTAKRTRSWRTRR